jgi:hypothetical protein
MNALKPTPAGLLLAALLFTSPGCDEGQDVGMVGGKVYPPLGSFVHVQFRRDLLGLASEKGSSPVNSDTGLVLASSGELRRMTEEFIVLEVANEPDRELWIPRENVLLLDVKRPSQPQPE